MSAGKLLVHPIMQASVNVLAPVYHILELAIHFHSLLLLQHSQQALFLLYVFFALKAG